MPYTSIRDYCFKSKFFGHLLLGQRTSHIRRRWMLALLLLAMCTIIYASSPLWLSGSAGKQNNLSNLDHTQTIEIPPPTLLRSLAKLNLSSADTEANSSVNSVASESNLIIKETNLSQRFETQFTEGWEAILMDYGQPSSTEGLLAELAPLSLPAFDNLLVISNLPEPTHQTITINPGDSLSSVFHQEKLPASELVAVMKTKHASYFKTLHPGQALEIHHEASSSVDDVRTLKQLIMVLDAQRRLIVESNDAGRFASRLEETQLNLAFKRVSGTVENSLYASMTSSGIPYQLALELGRIFGSVINFDKEVRKGDRYSLVYETYLNGDKLVRTGNILAAEFSNRGRIYRAVRFENAFGDADYYTPEGKSLKPAFSRYPVKFSRISSPFSRNRKHPVLGIRRPHLGVDLAAPTGTPIIAAGDGQVAHIGTKGGYGLTIILRHGTQYRTLYAHMSRYASGLKKGDRVRHGQVIGYVGSTGVSTGPHLHYELHVNGVHQDPLKVALPGGSPLDKSQLAKFTQQTGNLLAMLDQDDETLVASSSLNESSEPIRQQ